MIALLEHTLGVVLDGRWKGWLMQRHPDGHWVSLRKLEQEDPADSNPLAAIMNTKRDGDGSQ